ncbi:MAG: SUF system Fe-S cluster assembly regulator [Gammaproteobacteria bacterium]
MVLYKTFHKLELTFNKIMLKISKLADYGTVIMHYLARWPNQAFSAAQVAQQVQMKAPTVSKVLKLLSGAELVVATRGAGGGYRLARPAKEISIAEVIAAIERAPALTECSLGNNICAQDMDCPIKDNWRLINRLIVETLQSVTLHDMTQPLAQQPLLVNRLKVKLQAAAQSQNSCV